MIQTLKNTVPVSDRRQQMLNALLQGHTYHEIGRFFNVSRQRVYQIIFDTHDPDHVTDTYIIPGREHRKKQAQEQQHRESRTCPVCHTVFESTRKKPYGRKTCSTACKNKSIMKNRQRFFPPSAEEARQLRLEGLTWKQISEKYGYGAVAAPSLCGRVKYYEQKYLPSQKQIVGRKTKTSHHRVRVSMKSGGD